MKKSAYFSDVLFSFLLVALITLLLFRHFSLSLALSFPLACVCGLLAACAIAALLKSKRKNLDLKKSDESQKRKLLLHLALLSPNAQTDFFSHVLTAKRVSLLRLSTNDTLYSLLFRFAPVSADEIAKLSRQKTTKVKCVLCDRIDDEAKKLCAVLDIRVKTGEEVYALVKEQELLPKNYLGQESPPNKTKRRLQTAFSKTNSRRFFISGLLLLLTSLFTPFRLYYLIFSFILLFASLLIRIFGYS